MNPDSTLAVTNTCPKDGVHLSCACHSSLHAHVSIQDVGKDGGDHTALRPLDGPRRTRSDHRLPGGALPEAPPGLGHLKAHSSPIVNRQAEDGAAVDTPGTWRHPGYFGVMVDGTASSNAVALQLSARARRDGSPPSATWTWHCSTYRQRGRPNERDSVP